MKKIIKKAILLTSLLALWISLPLIASAGQISQTIHFSNEKGQVEVTPQLLYHAYLNASSHQQITGLPVKIYSVENSMKKFASVGDSIDAFCFSEEMCGLKMKILDLQPGNDIHETHTIVLSWWNFGWLQAVDKQDLRGQKGSADSIVILTFKNTKGGAQIELNQINVPDYKVKIQSPDGSIEIGPLSQIVNTHWSTLYWNPYRKYLKTVSN